MHPFIEKYQLALEIAQNDQPQSGQCGFEFEWNLLDSQFRPLLTVGIPPAQQSFVDYLRAHVLSPRLREYSQLEVFHWMTEWATRPYYHPHGAVAEGRLMEAALLNALHRAGRDFGEQLYAWHGNLPVLTTVDASSIPGSWNLAKRRYLERCVSMYGASLATAGTHTNLSLPDPLFAWDFVHLSPTERSGQHLDSFKSEFYITAARLFRAFAALFIATSASTPFRTEARNGNAVVVLTPYDSVRNLTFPNPPALDVPDLYRSYADYLRISYDLVQRGIRFGNNNWTPIRARSFAERVERLIAVTGEQLQALYARGLYAIGDPNAPQTAIEDTARQIEAQNLLARIDLPMGRVEVRTDDGGNPIETDIANLTLKLLLLLRFYADPTFGRAFRYDREDISRARRNEERAAQHGLRAEIENPFDAKPVAMRDFLRWTLAEVRPMAEALNLWRDLHPLTEMAAGAPNTAERLRTALKKELHNQDEVPLEVLRALAAERQAHVCRDVERIAADTNLPERPKLVEVLLHAREAAHADPEAPIRFRASLLRAEINLPAAQRTKTEEILHLAQRLIRIPSVTACPQERLEEVRLCALSIYDDLRAAGLVTHYLDGKYPAVFCHFPGGENAPVWLTGHFDVVEPEPDDSQFTPRIEGDYLHGRGAADMKTVVATYLVWMHDQMKLGAPYPPISLLLIGNEENGETEPVGTPHALRLLAEKGIQPPQFFIAGERTEERGDSLWGEVCTENRGIFRATLVAHGERAHSGVARASQDLTLRIAKIQAEVAQLAEQQLTLSRADAWKSQIRFPFLVVGQPDVYNITPQRALLGIEVRSIPQDDLQGFAAALRALAEAQSLTLEISVLENGIVCPPENPYLQALLRAVQTASGKPAQVGRKLPGTSARFAPGGQAVVWGQSGIAPHGAAERHYIPSIEPYYRALNAFADELKG
ncbi:MAG: hypothetical protein OHK0052_02100 [Anaerolineales bacterium]